MDLINLKNLLNTTLIPAAEEKLEASYITAVVITGLTVVFLGLIILILFVWAFGKIFTRKKKPEKKQADSAPTPVHTPVSAPPKPAAAGNKNDDEVIAVIAAAVAAMSEADGKSYRLKSVKAVRNKPSRSAWSMAGIQNNTTPF